MADGRALPDKKILAGIVALFAACSLLVYGQSLQNRFVAFDDNYLIYQNPIITRITPRTLRHVFTSYDPELYAPLTTVSYQLDYRMGGLEPFVYHAQNLLWHTLNALLVAWVLWLLAGSAPAAVMLGLLFLVHPQNTEAVAWASGRKDVLSTFFFLSSMIAYLRYREGDSRTAYWGGIVLFFLGLLAKVLVITLPVVLLLLDWREGRRLSRGAFREKIPWFALSLVFGIIALFGKQNAFVVTTASQKILMAFKSTWFTFETFVWPAHLSVLYPYSGAVTVSSPDFLLPMAGVVLLCIIAIASMRWSREVAFALSFFVITLSPTLINFAKGNEIYMGSDRYGYIPMVGLLVLTAVGVETLRQRNRAHSLVLLGVVATLTALAGIGAFLQAKNWRNSEALFTSALQNSPDSLTARNNLGMEYLSQGKNDAALEQFNTLLSKRTWPVTLVNRGLLRFREGDIATAVADYTRAMKLDPLYYDAYYELGNVAYRQGNYVDAVKLYTKAFALNPQYGNALNNLGATYLQLNQPGKAAETFKKLLVLNPLFTQAYYNIAVIDEQAGRFQEAAKMYQQALELNPDDPDALAGLARVRAAQR